ncbi:restriction endonuclease subunit S [Mangrovicoccus sp. HB161399]|uniref:restriction endonuclease subunit S n=1 Tax=Mangrovicoccus sp. HB161399 TaxID=2720392 RepID=UPI001553D75C|nr:restriction endonuclease subunit S [Mangrovicoccus sp. HB161399]
MREFALGELLEIKHGFAFSSQYASDEPTDYVLLTPGNFHVEKRLYFGPKTKFYDGPIPTDYVLKNGDILVVMTDLTKDMAILGNAVVLKSELPVLHNQRIGLVQIKNPSGLDRGFLCCLLNSDLVQRHVRATASGSTVRHTSPKRILEVPVGIPALSEQRKIAEILRTWEEALEKLTALRAAKERRLGALRAALLFGRLRLKGLRHNWAPTRLEAVTQELTKRNGAKGLGRECVMGVTKAEGVVPMREQTIAADISRYKRLPPRAFAYNPMRINVGSIAMNEREEAALVSPDYVVFVCDADGLDPDYLDHLRKTSWWAHYINSGGSGSVRQRTYYADLAALKLPLPDLDEQKAIAAVLNTSRDDLAATEREIEAVTLQKRGLMQKLLTGEWRAPLEPTPTTEEASHAG